MNLFVFAIFAIYCFFGAVIGVSAKSLHKLPDGFVQCKRNDPKFNACLQRAISLAVPELVRGVPKYQLPPIEPLKISKLNVDQGTGPVAIKLNFTDLNVHGLGSAKIQEASLDFEKLKLSFKGNFAKNIVLDGDYRINGKVLVLPIAGNGRSKFVLSGFSVQVEFLFEEIEKDGDKYWNVRRIGFTFSVTKLNMNLQNLFNGDKALGDNMNKFLNENWPEILGELRPTFSSAFSGAFTQIAQRFFSKVPSSLVFPEK